MSQDLFKNKQRNFILQQGFDEPLPMTCSLQYKALQFQPWVVFLTLCIATLLKSPVIFLLLGVVLLWSAALPKRNPFEAVYNRTWGSRLDAVLLTPAPSPRRFAQFLASIFSFVSAGTLHQGWMTAFWIVDGAFLLAVFALVSAGFCFGSLMFHSLVGKSNFAKKTLPWAPVALVVISMNANIALAKKPPFEPEPMERQPTSTDSDLFKKTPTQPRAPLELPEVKDLPKPAATPAAKKEKKKKFKKSKRKKAVPAPTPHDSSETIVP